MLDFFSIIICLYRVFLYIFAYQYIKDMKSTTAQERKALEKKLIWGDVARIARLAEVNRRTVERWFNCENNNTVVEAMVIALFKKREETIKTKIEQL